MWSFIIYTNTVFDQIVGPGKKKRDIVEDMFKAAKEAGAEAVDKHDREKKSKQKAFTGGGFRWVTQGIHSTFILFMPDFRNLLFH